MTTNDPIDLERLLPAAVAAAFHAERFEQLLDWVREALPDALPADSPARADSQFARAFAFAFGRALWNAMPVRAGGRVLASVPEPNRNDPCPCGSGRKFKQCCVHAPSLAGALTPPVLWPAVLGLLPRAERVALAASARVPVQALGAYAFQALEAGRARDAVDVLEPRLGAPERHHDEHYAELVDLLCDAYDAISDKPRRKIAFLESTIRRAPRSPLRSEARQRLATIQMDAGRPDEAWQSLRDAQRDDPHSPALPMLEVHLLVSEGRVQEARERAEFWIRALERSGEGDGPGDRRLEFLHAVRRDPLGALGDVAIRASGDAAQSLAEWLAANQDRAVPVYRLQAVHFDSTAGNEDSSHPAQKAARAGAYELRAPPKLARAEAAWRAAFALGKPFSIGDQPFEQDDVWEPEAAGRWLAVLHAHPEAADSIDILDDLVTAVARHSSAGTAGFEHMLTDPLLARCEAILDRALAQQPSGALPWLIGGNRPALRMLVRRYQHCSAEGDLAGATAVAERLLRINPDDNHGMRFMLINEYLLQGQDERALQVALAYPDDLAPETRFGRVLALFRLRRLAEAEAALRAARKALPKILHYLLPSRIRRPELSGMGVTVGGDDQAWLYRDAMRAAWMGTPGMKEWLEKLARLK